MLADEIAQFLASQGLGLTVGSTAANGVWSVPFPTIASDTATCVIEYSGQAPLRSMSPTQSNPVFERAKFQVVSRDLPENAGTCRALQKSIQGVLQNMSGNLTTSTSGTTFYGYMDALQPPFFLKYDESARIYYAANYLAIKQVSP